jgi:hypothetical protein
MAENDPLLFRVYSEPDGTVYLLYEPQNWRVEVEAPVTEQSLETARLKLAKLGTQQLQETFVALEGETEANATPQQRANRRIKAVVEPASPSFFHYLKRLGESLFEGLLLIVLLALTVAGPYMLIRWSQETLPEVIHLILLLVVAVGLALAIYVTAVEEVRNQVLPDLKTLFGKHALFSLPALTLVLAASVFASLTFSLYNHGWVTLEPCSGLPVSPGRLADFYVWHFFKLVPLVKLNETLKWSEPLCYTQGRVGFLILLFQALVVLPCINTVRFYLKNRRSLTAMPYKYIYEPGWTPEGELKQ